MKSILLDVFAALLSSALVLLVVKSLCSWAYWRKEALRASVLRCLYWRYWKTKPQIFALDLWRMVQEHYPSASIGDVHQCLRDLVETGEVQFHEVPGGPERGYRNRRIYWLGAAAEDEEYVESATSRAWEGVAR